MQGFLLDIDEVLHGLFSYFEVDCSSLEDVKVFVADLFNRKEWWAALSSGLLTEEEVAQALLSDIYTKYILPKTNVNGVYMNGIGLQKDPHVELWPTLVRDVQHAIKSRLDNSVDE